MCSPIWGDFTHWGKLDTATDGLLNTEKRCANEKDSITATVQRNQEVFVQQKAQIQEKITAMVSVRTTLCLYPLTHFTFQLGKALQELKTKKESADAVTDTKLEKAVKDYELIQSNIKVSMASAAEAHTHKDTLLALLGNKQREEDKLFTDIRKKDELFTGAMVSPTH